MLGAVHHDTVNNIVIPKGWSPEKHAKKRKNTQLCKDVKSLLYILVGLCHYKHIPNTRRDCTMHTQTAAHTEQAQRIAEFQRDLKTREFEVHRDVHTLNKMKRELQYGESCFVPAEVEAKFTLGHTAKALVLILESAFSPEGKILTGKEAHMIVGTGYAAVTDPELWYEQTKHWTYFNAYELANDPRITKSRAALAMHGVDPSMLGLLMDALTNTRTSYQRKASVLVQYLQQMRVYARRHIVEAYAESLGADNAGLKSALSALQEQHNIQQEQIQALQEEMQQHGLRLEVVEKDMSDIAGLTRSERQVMVAYSHTPLASQQELADIAGVSVRTVTNAMKKMKDAHKND